MSLENGRLTIHALNLVITTDGGHWSVKTERGETAGWVEVERDEDNNAMGLTFIGARPQREGCVELTDNERAAVLAAVEASR